MAKKNSIPARIDFELKKIIENIAVKNNMSFPQASSEVAKTMNGLKVKQKKIKRDIIF